MSDGTHGDLRAEGEAAFAAGRFGSAIEAWRRWALNDPPPPEDAFWARLALAMRRIGRRDDLSALISDLSARGSAHIHAHLQFALLVNEQDGVDSGIAALDEAAQGRSHDDRLETSRIKVHLFSAAGRFDEALSSVREMRGLESPSTHIVMRTSLAIIERKMRTQSLKTAVRGEKLKAYWEDRRRFVYIHVCNEMIGVIGRSANVVVDVGSNGTPMLDAFPDECRKFSVDPMTPYAGAGVTQVRADFLEWRPPEPVDVATCFQVMEHVAEPQKFAARLLEVAEVSLVSVPFKEAPGLNPGHIHSMIDERTVADWFGRRPNYSYIARELDGGERIISVFDTRAGEQWPTLCGHCEFGLRFRYRWSMRGAPPVFAEFG